MSISVNGQSFVPPGFRFHPTEEELLNYYLRKKVACEKIDLDVIRDVDLNKLEPWDIQEKCRIGSTPQNDWYFFSHKDKKYPTGTRTNRATAAGFWKATGRDKVIYTSFKRIGMRKTLVFYMGRAPHGQKSDWIMHEYRLDERYDSLGSSGSTSLLADSMAQEEGWVVCRVFKKKNHLKVIGSPNNCTSTLSSDTKTSLMVHSTSDTALEQILLYMGRSCKLEREPINAVSSTGSTINSRYFCPIDTIIGSATNVHERFTKLPALESPTTLPCLPSGNIHNVDEETGLGDWAALDRLVASHLNGDDVNPFPFGSSAGRLLSSDFQQQNTGGGEGEGDLWSFTRSATSSASDNICHASHASM
ncbi:hypothetical protein HPP92_022091 [Vanilla planifolia]|uniref:NAC domain-containing protein n=1 Tax=Vanilla planifolia TaxID=51239 RepID=A0A835PP08_VANPL|nr:hypothetical protein HPP92_022091 [Vanilla planifolia]